MISLPPSGPDAAPDAPVYCSLHEMWDCDLCDECGHEAGAHTNLHDVPDPDWSTATCWAESVCDICLA